MAKNSQPYRAGGNMGRPDDRENVRDTQEYAADEGYDEYDEEGYDDYDYDYYDYELSRKRANRGCLIAFLAVLAVVVIVVLVGVFWIKGEIDGNRATATEPVVIDLNTSSGKTIGEMLEAEGLISNSNIFRFYVRFNGSSTGFQRGRFTLTPGMSYDEIIEVFSTEPPPRPTVDVTIPEGSTVIQFATRLEEGGVCEAQAFIDAANRIVAEEVAKGEGSQYIFLSHIELDPNTWMAAEGYLAANTFNFFTDEENAPDYAVHKLLAQMEADVSSLSEDIYGELAARGMSLRDLFTLASLVEEECSIPGLSGDELAARQKEVAGVFWNRLTKDISQTGLARRTMGSDTTDMYIQDWIARDYGGSFDAVRDQAPDLFNAYNTRDADAVREGLMVGPISSPSRTALEAALHPEDHNWFFFVNDLYGNIYVAYDYWTHQYNIGLAEAANAQYQAENPG